MHKWAKQIMECVKAKVDGIGIENFEGQNLDDLKDFTEIAKNIACFDKDYRIVEAMEKSEDNEDIMRMLEQYEDYPDRRFYDNYRYMRTGKYAPKGKGTYVGRRGYEEPPYWHRYPYDMTDTDYGDMERMRDMDRPHGRMYYTDMSDRIGMIDQPRSGSSTERDMREGRSGISRKHYMETKEQHKANTQQDKDAKMQSLDEYMKELSTDMTELITDMTPEERSMVKSKMSVLLTKM